MERDPTKRSATPTSTYFTFVSFPVRATSDRCPTTAVCISVVLYLAYLSGTSQCYSFSEKLFRLVPRTKRLSVLGGHVVDVCSQHQHNSSQFLPILHSHQAIRVFNTIEQEPSLSSASWRQRARCQSVVITVRRHVPII